MESRLEASRKRTRSSLPRIEFQEPTPKWVLSRGKLDSGTIRSSGEEDAQWFLCQCQGHPSFGQNVLRPRTYVVLNKRRTSLRTEEKRNSTCSSGGKHSCKLAKRIWNRTASMDSTRPTRLAHRSVDDTFDEDTASFHTALRVSLATRKKLPSFPKRRCSGHANAGLWLPCRAAADI